MKSILTKAMGSASRKMGEGYFPQLYKMMARLPESNKLYYLDKQNSIYGAAQQTMGGQSQLLSPSGEPIRTNTDLPALVPADMPFTHYPDGSHFFAKIGDGVGFHLQKDKNMQEMPNYGRLSSEGKDIIENYMRWHKAGFGSPHISQLLEELVPHFGKDMVVRPNHAGTIGALIVKPNSPLRVTDPEVRGQMADIFRKQGIHAIDWRPLPDEFGYHRIRAFQPFLDQYHRETGAVRPLDLYHPFRVPKEFLVDARARNRGSTA